MLHDWNGEQWAVSVTDHEVKEPRYIGKRQFQEGMVPLVQRKESFVLNSRFATVIPLCYQDIPRASRVPVPRPAGLRVNWFPLRNNVIKKWL